MRTKRESAGSSVLRRTPLIVALAGAFMVPATAFAAADPNLVVTDTSDNCCTIGSLRYAISYANGNCGTNASPVITFAIPSGPFVISPSSALPKFSCASGPYNPTVDGSSQPGFVANSSPTGFNAAIPITIDGASAIYGGSCLVEMIDAAGYGGTLTMKGLEVRNFAAGYGVCGRLNLLGNRIVANSSGVDAKSGSSIGGGAMADRNVIANHVSGFGIHFDGSTSIVGNLIGTTDGVTAAPNSIGIQWCFCTPPTGTISGNVIGSSSVGISVSDELMTISDNRIGATADGSALMTTGAVGISLQYSYGSTISGNTIVGQGVGIENRVGQNVTISGNTIGVNKTGTAALPNSVGVMVENATGTVIDNNTISGNTMMGVSLFDASGTSMTGNRIGTNAAVTAPIPNGDGVQAACSTSLTLVNNVVKGNSGIGMTLWAIQSSTLDANTVGGNAGHGIEMSYSSCSTPKSITFDANNESDDNQITNNTIANNSGTGLFIEGGSRNNVFMNQVFANGNDGVRIDSHYDPTTAAVISAAVGNSIVQNVIYGNAAKNINLGFPGGPLPNDPFDADTNKPNNWQNRPVITAVTGDTANNWTMVDFSLDSKQGIYRVDFFSNPAPGAPAGRVYGGNTFITLNTDGPASGSFAIPGLVDYVSAVATYSGPTVPLDVIIIRDSSEFADIVAAAPLPVPGVTMTPTSIDFGDVVVGRQAGPSTITISSQGTADYVISALRDTTCAGPAICSTGAFVCSTSCAEGTPYRPGTSCSISASFAPTTLGAQSKTLALCDNTGTNKTMTLSGNGVPPPAVDISYTPASFSFGEVLVGTQSAPHGFRLTNAGASQVYLGPVSTTGDFVVTGNTCGSTLAAGASCNTDVAFMPATRGGQNGSVRVTGSNTPPATPAALRSKVTTATTATASALLQGSGLQFGDLRLPASISFGTLVLHGDAATRQLQLTNTGNGPLAIGGITVSGPFTMTNDCGASLTVLASCTVSVRFDPATLGSFNGTLTIVSDAPGGSRAIALTAEVIADARPVVRVDPVSIGFGERLIGSASPTSRVVVTNEGAQVAVLGTMGFVQPETGKSEYSISGTNCTASLAPQASCFVDLVLKPLGFGSRNGQFIVPSNSADSPRVVNLGGTGCRPFVTGANRAPRDPCAP